LENFNTKIFKTVLPVLYECEKYTLALTEDVSVWMFLINALRLHLNKKEKVMVSAVYCIIE
jgi:hypothetical protein